MKINVQVLTKKIEVEVGEGRQNIKWLAQVVSTRIAYYKILRSSFEEEKQLITGMLAADGSVLDPNATIVDVVEEDDVIVANVTDQVSSDQFGNPVVPVWRQAAFIHSEAGTMFGRGYEAWKRNRSRMRTATTPGEPAQDCLVFVGDLSDADVFAALELDWPMIDWSWAVLEPSERFLFRLKDALKSHYGVICRIFAFCAGSGRPGERYGLTLADFRHILYCSGLFKYSAAKAMENVFVLAAGDLPADNGTSRPATATTAEVPAFVLMSRSEFVEAICRIAVGVHPPASYTAEENEAHVMRSVIDLLSGRLRKYWRALDEQMESCNNQFNRDLLMHCETYLKRIFYSYGSISKDGPVITVDTFRDIVYGSNIAEERLSYNQILEDVFLRQCRVVMPHVFGYGEFVTKEQSGTIARSGFGGSKKSGASEASTPRGSDNDIQEMTFSEFREALVKAVKYAFSKSDELTDNEKMQAGFETLTQVATRLHK